MAVGRIKSTELSAIAAAIRSKSGESTVYKPAEMAAAIEAIPTGGSAVIESKSITANGTYTVPTGVDGYNPVTVDVQPNLQSKTATENGTVTPDEGYDGLSSVLVNVSGGGGSYHTNTVPSAADGADGDTYITRFVAPSGYTRLSYIAGSGSQYIDVGIVGTDKTNFELAITSNRGGATWATIIGAGAGNVNMAVSLHIRYDGYFGWQCGTNYYVNSAGGFYVDASADFPGWPHVVYTTDTKLRKNDVDVATIMHPAVTTPCNLYLLACNYNGVATSATSGVRVYYAAIYDNGAPVRLFLPVRRDADGVIGFIDLLHDTFYANIGTGSFVAGADVAAKDCAFLFYKKSGGQWQFSGFSMTANEEI